MGLCLAKGGPGQYHGQIEAYENEDDGFCTPEGVSSQFESPNPSGRYSFAHLETPRMSADVGDLGALGSLFYKRGSRSRGMTASSNYISPLGMFLGGVSGRSRVHHVNQICAGDCSLASYLASPLLKGFDVHAMEAVAKSYAESAAMAAARDAFVFLEENDASLVSNPSGETLTGRAEVSSAEDCEDLDDDLAKSCDSEEWDEPNSEKPDDSVKSAKSSGFQPRNEGTNERWLSLLSAVQARAKARRNQMRKESGEMMPGLNETCSGSKKKTVRFQLGGVEEGFTDDDDIRPGKKDEIYLTLDTEDENEVEDEVKLDGIESKLAAPFEFCQDRVKDLELSAGKPVLDDRVADEEDFHRLSTACTEFGEACIDFERGACEIAASDRQEGGYFLNWRDGRESAALGQDVIEAEFVGYQYASDFSVGISGVPRGSSVAGTYPNERIHHVLPELFSTSQYLLSETSFGSDQRAEEAIDLVISSVHAQEGQEGEHEENGDSELQGRSEAEQVDREVGDQEERQEEEQAERKDIEAEEAKVVDFESSHRPEDDDLATSGNVVALVDESSGSQRTPSSTSQDVLAGRAPSPIPVGCVVVESRKADGSRLNLQILELSEVRLPERGENNFGFFHARILYSGGSSPSGSEHNSDNEDREDHEGGAFSFPVLVPFSNQSSETLHFRESRKPWRDRPVGDVETPITNRSTRPHARVSHPSSQAQDFKETKWTEDYVLDDPDNICDPRYSFSFDTGKVESKRPHEIVLPSRQSRSLSSTPVFSPSNLPSTPRSTLCQWAPNEVPSVPHVAKSRRSLNRKLKFYSLERASFAAGAKRSRSPAAPRFCRRDRRQDVDGDSDSDLFEIETMSGTNAMGSSRTPPPTPTKILRKAPAATFDIDKLTSSMAQVSRTRPKRSTLVGREKSGSLLSVRGSEGRCLPGERKRDHGVFQLHQPPTNSLKGRAMLKLGLLRRGSKTYGYGMSDHSRESPLYGSSEALGSEYLENNPPPSAALNFAQCGQCLVDEERRAHKYAFEWYCGAPAPHVEKRHEGFSYHVRNPSKEDRTFAVKN